MSLRFPSLVLFCLLFFFSCKKKVAVIPGSILFLGHTYQNITEIDKRLLSLDLDQYENIWLGGDICGASDSTYAMLAYINQHFKVNQPNNYWALGNHDVISNNYNWISAITEKPDFYTRHQNGLTIMVLNTNLDSFQCERLEAQSEMFHHVCDTIQSSSHLILLSHYVIWNHVKGLPNLWQRANANKPYWLSQCDPKSRYEHVMHQRLVEVRKRDVEVLFISGDYGQKEKFFQQQSEDGIWFIGSGLDHTNRYMPDSLKDASDHILYFKHDPATRRLDWQFLNLDSLAERANAFF